MRLNIASITARLKKLDQYINELKKHQRLELKEFESNFTIQLAVERAFQAAIECCIDIGNHIISTFGLERPEEQKDIFEILARAGYIEREYAELMVKMVSFRNRLVHLYWDVDVRRLHQYVQEDIPLFERFKIFVIQLIESDQQKKG